MLDQYMYRISIYDIFIYSLGPNQTRALIALINYNAKLVELFLMGKGKIRNKIT